MNSLLTKRGRTYAAGCYFHNNHLKPAIILQNWQTLHKTDNPLHKTDNIIG